MYRNIYYYVDPETRLGMVKLWTWNDLNEPVTIDMPFESSLYYEDPQGSYQSIYGSALQKKSFKNVHFRRKWMQENPRYKFFSVKQPEVEFLHEVYHKVNKDISFTANALYLHYIDIEIAVEDEFPDPMEAKYPINLITVYDTGTKSYITWAMPSESGINIDQIKSDVEYKKKCPINWDNVDLRVFEAESDLMDDYLTWHTNNYPDAIVGWNSMSFDIPYIVGRLRKLLGVKRLNTYSPVGKIKAREFESRFGASIEYQVIGITMFDYMLLYRDKFNYSPRASYALNNICNIELGDSVGKLEFECTFKEFYQTRFQDYAEYNIRDVELLVMLDERLKYIDLARSCCNRGLVNYNMVYKAMPYVYNSLIVDEMKKQNRKFPSPQERDESTGKFVGAYVMAPRAGKYDFAASMDLKSLYPNIIIMTNNSPDTKFGIITERAQSSVTIRLADGTIKTITNNQLEKLLSKHCTIASNDVMFYKPEVKKGIIPAFLTDLYAERKAVQKEMRVANDKIYDLTELIKSGNSDDTTQKLLDDQEYISGATFTSQLTTKIILNTTYGIMGNPYCDIFDLECAEAVTTCGQTILKGSQKFVNAYMQKAYQVKGESVIYGDTDSQYVDVAPLVLAATGKTIGLNDAEVTACLSAFDDIVDMTNQYAFEYLVKKVFRSSLNRIEFEREVFSEGSIFLAKKRYILRLRNDDGVMCDKFKYMGVEVKRNKIPMPVKTLMKDFIEDSVREHWTSTDANIRMKEIWETYLTFKPSDVANIQGLSTAKKSTGFMTCEKGAGVHARSAIYYNHFIKRHSLGDRYNPIMQGDKVRYYYVKKNQYGIDVIGYNDKYPEEYDNLFQMNYDIMFQKQFLKGVEGIFDVCNWTRFDPDFCEDLFNI